MTCHHCQQQLLPYLYDLLEPQEHADFVTHLGGCPDCRQALQSAREQQGMLAEAVKEQHPEIVFKAPTKATPACTAPTVAMHRPPRRLVLLNRWAAAAAMLFVLFTAGSAIGWTVWRDSSDAVLAGRERLVRAKSDLAKSQEELNQKKSQTQKEIRAIQEQIDSLFHDWKNKETQTRKLIEDKRAESRINVYGPQVAQAGAPQKYEIERNVVGNYEQNPPGLSGKGGKPKDQQQDMQPGTMSPSQARVVNRKTGETLYQQELRYQANNRAQFDLPVLQFKPGDDLVIEFHAQTPDGKLVVLRDDLKIVFPEYVTHLATDRPLYLPGDSVRFRSLTLERFSLKPAQEPFHLRYRIVGPKNEEIYRHEVVSRLVAGPNKELWKGPGGAELHGLGAGEFWLPADLPVGQYTLLVNEVNERFNEEKRSFLVQRWQQARFTKELTFHRTSYGAGDQIKFQARVVSIQPGQQPRQVNARVIIDGQKVLDQPLNIDQNGKAAFECSVPVILPRGVGKVTLECNDDGDSETLVRDLPLVTRDLQVDFYPEGGDLIAGAPNRVYFQARTSGNSPADLEGRIVDEMEREVARVQTLSDAAEPGINQGLGYFTFVPEARKKYKLIVDSPIGIERTVPLPAIKEQGVVMTIPDAVVENQIDVMLQSVKQRRELLVGVYCRGRMIDHQFVRAGANQPVQVTLKPALGVGGVYRVTVFEITRLPQEIVHRPIAERLIYRKSAEKVEVEIKSDRASYQPGEPVRLTLNAKNEKNVFVPSVAMVAVVDTNVFKHAGERTARSMPTHFLLTTEVRNPEELESADFLLGDHPQAAQALDLLLGCQGWRRFAEQDPQMFVRQQQQGRAPSFLANSVNPVAQFVGMDQQDIEKLDRGFVQQAIELQKKLGEAEKQATAPDEQHQAVVAKASVVAQEKSQVDEAERLVRETRVSFIQFGLGGALLTLLFLGFFLVSVGLHRFSEGDGRPGAWLTAGLGLLGFLFLASIVGTITFMGENPMEENKQNPRFFGAVANEKAKTVPLVEPIEREAIYLPEDAEDLQRLAPAAAGPRKQPESGPNERNVFDGDGKPGMQLAQNAPAPPPVPADELEDRKLRREGDFQALLLKGLRRRVQMPAVHDPAVVREYAHQRQPKKDAAAREFAQTIYWHPVLVMPDGKAAIQFDLADSVARYEVLVVSHTFDGRLGANRLELAAKLPVKVDLRVPLEVSDRDQVTVQAAMQNESSKATTATLRARGLGLEFTDRTDREVAIKANERTRQVFNVRPNLREGTAVLRVVGKTGGIGTAVERRLKVVPDGFPVVGSISGVIEGGPVEHEITLPANWNSGTLQVEARFFPSPLAELSGASEGLLGEPTASFEPTVSSNYLNAMILQYLRRTKQPNPILEGQARQRLRSGYHRMADFECLDPARPGETRGFEWFGPPAAPDAALTAYGLLQFREMAKVCSVDEAMLERTQQFLRGPRDQKASSVNQAYVLWALTESGTKVGFDKDLLALREQAKKQKDPYLLTLVGLSYLNVHKTLDGVGLLQVVAEQQKADGSVAGAETSITGSQGRDLDVETTSLAILGWLKAGKAGDFHQNIQKGVQWINKQRRGAGTFGGTQATVLALKALVAHYQKEPRVLDQGEAGMSIRADAKGPDDFARTSFSPRSQDPLTLTLASENLLKPGKNVIHLNVTGRNAMPYTLTWTYRTQTLAIDAKAPLKLSARLNQLQAREGETVKLSATLENVSGQHQGLAVAIFGLPAGLSFPDGGAQLNALAPKAGKFSAWELRGRELVLYWRDLSAHAKVEMDFDLVCRMPGLYYGPASRAYAYYDADRKTWVDPLSLRIHPAE